MNKKAHGIDVAVLLIFFCRDEQFAKVFEQVKIARPSKLFLYQDGARKGNENDLIGIQKCREIAENIDWDCEVFKYYQEKNVGCDPSEFIAQKWAFSYVDKCIVLEDDDVPSQSFFPFCKELLDKYENDERINMICGMNNNDITEEIDDSYLFTQRGSIWGWASWRRVIEQWDENYSILDDEAGLRLMRDNFYDNSFDEWLEILKKHRQTGRAHYESINAIHMFLQNMINIVPKYNMITNIGVGNVTTHGGNDIRTYPKKIRNLMYKKRYEIEFPLKHPKYVMINKDFEKKMNFTKKDKFYMRLEKAFLRVKYQGLKETLKLYIKRLRGKK